MLLEFSVTNWRSYHTKATLCMKATSEENHKEHLAEVKSSGEIERVLPIVSIYGANASGKTNLIDALNFAQEFILKGTSSFEGEIRVKPFKLAKTGTSNDIVHFKFKLLIKNITYDFEFSLTKTTVLEEKLFCYNRDKKLIYHRKYDLSTEEYNYKEAQNVFFKDHENDNALLYAAYKGARKNQLFLTNTISQQIALFKPIYDWFKNDLVLFNSRIMPKVNCYTNNHDFYEAINKLISYLDIGISQISTDKYSPEASAEFLKNANSELISTLKEELVEQEAFGFDDMLVMKESGELTLGRLVTYHKGEDNKKIKFRITEESRGTRKLIELLPIFLDLFIPGSTRVLILDEIETSLHPLLIIRLIQWYLENCDAKSRTQFIFTTHNTLLLDQNIFRRDEIWITERNKFGSSELYSLSEYEDIKDEEDLEQDFLLGRLGGIPCLPFSSIKSLINLKDLSNAKKKK